MSLQIDQTILFRLGRNGPIVQGRITGISPRGLLLINATWLEQDRDITVVDTLPSEETER